VPNSASLQYKTGATPESKTNPAIANAGSGALWLGTADGVYTTKDGLAAAGVHALYRDHSGQFVDRECGPLGRADALCERQVQDNHRKRRLSTNRVGAEGVMPGVLVERCGTDWQDVIASTTTDSEGHFAFTTSTRKGLCYVQFSLAGANTLSLKVKLTDKTDKDLFIVLDRACNSLETLAFVTLPWQRSRVRVSSSPPEKFFFRFSALPPHPFCCSFANRILSRLFSAVQQEFESSILTGKRQLRYSRPPYMKFGYLHQGS
jgi:hypothetical protein